MGPEDAATELKKGLEEVSRMMQAYTRALLASQ
jgi:hypothetical protein